MSHTLKTIPLCQLKASKRNVRKTDRLADIEQIAASIETNGLLENLIVLPAGKRDNYEVIAGGRRLAALKLLAKRKTLENDHPVACLVVDEPNAVAEISLAENFVRSPLHPADQFDAFAGLVGQGLSADDVAARFGVTPTFVQQRLKLASVSPRLVQEYRSGTMTLEQLTAFTLSDDHQAQEGLWFDSPYAEISAAAIRRLLTNSQVEASDRRVRFVGATAYEAAGGVIVRDLFDSESEGYFADSQLLDRLVAEKLDAAADPVRAEGWNWVEIRPDSDLVRLGRYGQAHTIAVDLSAADEERLSALSERYDQLIADLDDSVDGETPELDQLSAEIVVLQSLKETWPDTEKAVSGVIVSLNWDGSLLITRGLLRDDAMTGEEPEKAQPKRSVRTGYPDSVILDLSAHRTAAMRALVGREPSTALLALLHAMVEQLLYRGGSRSCLNLHTSEVMLDRASPTAVTSAAGVEFLARHRSWTERLPDQEQLWGWLTTLASEDRLDLIAHCVAMTVNELEPPDQHRSPRDTATLARAVNLDMNQWWRPTVANFFGRLTKAEILEIVAEGISPQDARRLEGLKKDAMAAQAEQLFSLTAWLPVSLRPLAAREQTI